MKIESIKLDDIRIDGGTQSRAKINVEVVDEYAEIGVQKMPPVCVCFDGAHYWLTDGFHRWHAAKKNGDKTIQANIIHELIDDAIKHAAAANTIHGQRRTNADKRKAVHMLLSHPKWSKMSDRAIAEHCVVGHPLVAEIRAQLEELPVEKLVSAPETPKSAPKRIGKDGKSRVAPKSKIPDTAPQKPKDGRGQPVSLREVVIALKAVPEFEQVIRDAQALKRGIKAVAQLEGGAELAGGIEKEITVAIDNLIARLKGCVPFTTCPYMPNCETKTCKTCRGTKWITEQVWERLPKEIRK